MTMTLTMTMTMMAVNLMAVALLESKGVLTAGQFRECFKELRLGLDPSRRWHTC